MNEEKSLESFDSLFDEDFYFFLRKGDYFFVTESGKLYHALAPRDGQKSRKMKGAVTDPYRPIVAIIEDANHEKVWLFVKDKFASDKHDFFFELKETMRPESFDPTKLTPSKAEGRAKLLLEYLPLISAKAKQP